MKTLIASLLLAFSTMAVASDIVTDSKDTVLASFRYTRQGHSDVTKPHGQFEIFSRVKTVSVQNDEALTGNLLKQVEQDLEKSDILVEKLMKGPISTLFHNRLNLEAAIDLIESGAVRQSISDLKALNEASTQLKYKIKVANYKSNDDEKCKALKRSCSGSYSIETIIDIIK